MTSKNEIRDKLLKELDLAVDLKQFEIANEIATILIKLHRMD